MNCSLTPNIFENFPHGSGKRIRCAKYFTLVTILSHCTILHNPNLSKIIWPCLKDAGFYSRIFSIRNGFISDYFIDPKELNALLAATSNEFHPCSPNVCIRVSFYPSRNSQARAVCWPLDVFNAHSRTSFWASVNQTFHGSTRRSLRNRKNSLWHHRTLSSTITEIFEKTKENWTTTTAPKLNT